MGMKICRNCRNRRFEGMFGWDYCLDYEMSASEEEETKLAAKCSRYEEEDQEEGHYTPSSTAGDYGPGNPWDAPGMSVRDFI